MKIKKKRVRRVFTAEEKVKAVLAVWSERRTITEMSREMDVCYAQLSKWQNLAMEAMLSALESKREQEKAPALNLRLEKLLERKSSSRKGASGREVKRAQNLKDSTQNREK